MMASGLEGTTAGRHPLTAIVDDDVLLGWGREHLRPLPWRATRDPWAVLVSEVMAQQTGVDRVIPKWHELLGRWPTPGDLARADLADVLQLWAGLGYPRRARNLHRAAGAIVEVHGGAVPRDLGALLALPGVGPYTARAVLAFAYEEQVGVVDTNVARVLARCDGRRLTAVEAQAKADEWASAVDPWLWNQSIMEVGALHCRPTARCDGCPLDTACAWSSADDDAIDPAQGSAGVSRRQAAFRGSDREARGRLLAAALDAPVPADGLARASGLSDDVARADRVARGLFADGLLDRGADGSWIAPRVGVIRSEFGSEEES
jgi:A/G-specific adenine glycosylase